MTIRASIISQYHASLDMLQQAVIRCPDSLWDDRQYKNVFWHVAYHTLRYVHLYLQASAQDFVPWAKHNEAYHRLEKLPLGAAYSKEDILAYLEICRQQVEEQVAAMDLDAPSGFGWLPFNKLELQFYNIRHIQQHVGELCERLGVSGGIDVDWVGKKSGA